MLLRMVVESVGGNAGGPKLVVLRPASADDSNNDPNMEWTAPGGKPSAELRFYISNQEHYDDFEQDAVYDVDVDISTGSKTAAKPTAAARTATSTTPTSGATQGATQPSGATPGTSAPSTSA